VFKSPLQLQGVDFIWCKHFQSDSRLSELERDFCECVLGYGPSARIPLAFLEIYRRALSLVKPGDETLYSLQKDFESLDNGQAAVVRNENGYYVVKKNRENGAALWLWLPPGTPVNELEVLTDRFADSLPFWQLPNYLR
jgi:hypothetical protein